MKNKILVILFALTVMSGCSFVKDKVNETKILDDMNKTVANQNKNIDLSIKAAEQIEQLATNMESSPNGLSDAKRKEALSLLENAVKDVKAYSEGAKKIHDGMPQLKELATKFQDAETKKLAEQFVVDFEKGMKTEIEVSAAQGQFVGVFGKFLKDSTDKNATELENAESKFNNALKQQEKDITQFNQSWKKFVEKAGSKVEESK
ncbi:hypothetical protein SAMN04487866_101491 [Thermoactinomyces sp. DSM 45891]|uniref:hypothetical protein n=1 Tax=Thermoactinomyces sp. DSM 45891 TaxID=1761907 RepID=UPI000923477F|nr:hypothetical protein [Thermoactinomyces sp. DSM 45891]SFX09165.1 hypothetical protein SAMN04487866_101491 [Thermoactinomyces sp. DSM 45891]